MEREFRKRIAGSRQNENGESGSVSITFFPLLFQYLCTFFSSCFSKRADFFSYNDLDAQIDFFLSFFGGFFNLQKSKQCNIFIMLFSNFYSRMETEKSLKV